MQRITRQACDAARHALGPDATPEMVAEAVGGAVSTVLSRYTVRERKLWRIRIRSGPLKAERAAVVKALRSKMLREGRVLTFAESGLPMDQVRRLGGFTRLLREAGARPIRAGRPPKVPRPQAWTGGLASARHWQQGAV
jgi:hypothetical protein